MTDSFTIQAATTPAAMDALRPQWDELLARSDASVFQSWEWTAAWWRHFGRGRLWILTAWRDGELFGLAPLFIERYGRVLLRRLLILGTGSSDYLGFVLREGAAPETAAALVRRIAEEQRRWDFCDFQQLPEGSALASTEAPPGVRDRRFIQEVCPFVPLPASWHDYLQRVGKKQRSNLGYYRRLLERSFRVDWKHAGERDIVNCMENLFRLHQKRWNRRWLPGAFAGRRAREFHLEAAKEFLSRGWLRLHVLLLDGKAAAALYCFQYRERGYYYLGGFETELARYSLGTVLTGRAIETAIEEGAVEFDFLRGNEAYKYSWQAEDRHNWRRLWWKPRGAPALAPTLNAIERRVEMWVKAYARSRR